MLLPPASVIIILSLSRMPSYAPHMVSFVASSSNHAPTSNFVANSSNFVFPHCAVPYSILFSALSPFPISSHITASYLTSFVTASLARTSVSFVFPCSRQPFYHISRILYSPPSFLYLNCHQALLSPSSFSHPFSHSSRIFCTSLSPRIPPFRSCVYICARTVFGRVCTHSLAREAISGEWRDGDECDATGR